MQSLLKGGRQSGHAHMRDKQGGVQESLYVESDSPPRLDHRGADTVHRATLSAAEQASAKVLPARLRTQFHASSPRGPRCRRQRCCAVCALSVSANTLLIVSTFDSPDWPTFYNRCRCPL